MGSCGEAASGESDRRSGSLAWRIDQAKIENREGTYDHFKTRGLCVDGLERREINAETQRARSVLRQDARGKLTARLGGRAYTGEEKTAGLKTRRYTGEVRHRVRTCSLGMWGAPSCGTSTPRAQARVLCHNDPKTGVVVAQQH